MRKRTVYAKAGEYIRGVARAGEYGSSWCAEGCKGKRRRAGRLHRETDITNFIIRSHVPTVRPFSRVWQATWR